MKREPEGPPEPVDCATEDGRATAPSGDLTDGMDGASSRTDPRRGSLRPLVLAGVCALFLFALARTAWICDDAFISLRVSWNLAEGYGLRWNPTERVQVFTNPLWVLVTALLHAVFGELYYSVLALSAALALATFARILWSSSAWTAAVVGSTLILSKAFVEYSTSGLENPLTNLLLALFVLSFLRGALDPRHLARLGLLAGLLAVNRLDTLVLTAPMLAYALARARSFAGLRALLLGLTPLFAWTAFAWFYFGFPLPNTAYAKVFGLGVPRSRLLWQAWLYVESSWGLDRMTLPAIGIAVALGFASAASRARCVAAAIALHLSYVAWVGADFMSGRFFVVALVAGASLVAHLDPLRTARTPARVVALLAALALGFLSPTPTLLSGTDYEETKIPDNGIADERGYYFQKGGLWSERANEWDPLIGPPGENFAQEPTMFLVTGAGHIGYQLGPKAHIVDVFGLTDPLVARLPIRDLEMFRPGHIEREIPLDYLQYTWSDEAEIGDERLAGYCRDLRLVASGPLWSLERLRAIARFALGENRPLLVAWLRDRADVGGPPVVPAERLMPGVADGAQWYEPGVAAFTRGILLVELEERRFERAIELGVDANDSYYVLLGDDAGAFGGAVLVDVARSGVYSAGILRRRVELPTVAGERGYRWIVVGAITGDGVFCLGSLRFLEGE